MTTIEKIICSILITIALAVLVFLGGLFYFGYNLLM